MGPLLVTKAVADGKQPAGPPERRNKNGTAEFTAGPSRHCRSGKPGGSSHQSDSAGTRRTSTGSLVRGRGGERRLTHSDRTWRYSLGNSDTAMGLSTQGRKHRDWHSGSARVLSPYDFWDHFNAQRSEGLDSRRRRNSRNQSLRIRAISGSPQRPRIRRTLANVHPSFCCLGGRLSVFVALLLMVFH
jgi:hypothetical protein